MYLSIPGKAEIRVHKDEDEYLSFMGDVYDKTPLHLQFTPEGKRNIDPFGEINRYLASLTTSQSEKLYQVYQQVPPIFEMHYSKWVDALKVIVRDIYDICDPERITRYVDQYQLAGPMDQIGLSANENSDPERTYNADKYSRLMGMAVALRLVVPIWGDFLKQMTVFIDRKQARIQAPQILADSKIVKLQAYEEMVRFVEVTLESIKVDMATMITGLGSDIQTDICIGTVLVRRVAPGLISTRENMVSAMFYNVQQQLSRRETIKEKRPEGSDDDERDHMGVYLIKEEIPAGQIAINDLYCENVVNMILNTDPTVPNALAKACAKLAKEMRNSDFTPFEYNLRLANWSLKGVDPDTLGSISPDNKINVLATTFGLLLHWGYPGLALLATAQPLVDDSGKPKTTQVSRKQIPAHLDQELDRIYIRRRVGRDEVNVARQAINSYYKLVHGLIHMAFIPEGYESIFIDNRLIDSETGLFATHGESAVWLTEVIIKVHG